ncbi:hypothetical protein NE237_030017 [Protea cynaroides]|uniref:Glycoside hydrolase family 19 catalytic domain-containing protein n=1 Tax=Protea cynaroides TaxID=273540 RepID=A0A9Q0GVC3_9MAGN|nr:hypothetical protein NE237_030017 [Protea cynaroides]
MTSCLSLFFLYTSGGYGVATRGPYAWGLCYNHEMSPTHSYCDSSEYVYPRTPGAEYYGRGALPVYWNYNYGVIGKGIKVDLLNHPEYLEQNATIAFQLPSCYVEMDEPSQEAPSICP